MAGPSVEQRLAALEKVCSGLLYGGPEEERMVKWTEEFYSSPSEPSHPIAKPPDTGHPKPPAVGSKPLKA